MRIILKHKILHMKTDYKSEINYSIGIFILSFLLAIVSLYKSKTPPFYYQSYFAPALMIACDKSYTDVVPFGDSLLPQKFLNREISHLKCSDLPQKLSKNDGIKGGQIWFYLMQYAGNVWKVTGIKWWPIDYSAALFSAFSVLLAFKLLRLTVSIHVAFVAGLLFSIYQLNYVSSFRDYSKVPFIFGIIYILAVDLCYNLKISQKFLAAFGVGCLTAIGYGFRADVSVLIPVCLLYYLLNLEFTNWGNFLKKILIPIAFIAGFGLFFFPHYLIIKNTGSCSFHFALLGLANKFYVKLGLIPAAAYSVINAYNDRDVAFMAASYADRVLNIKEPIPICGLLYEQITKQLFFSYLNLIPVDFYRKVIKAPLAIMGIFILPLILYIPIIWNENKKYMVLLYSLILYLCAISIIQFENRHYFYLMIFPIVAAAGVFNWMSQNKYNTYMYLKLIATKRIITVFSLCLCALAMVDYGLFQYQFRRLTDYGERLEKLTSVDLTRNALNNDRSEVDFKYDISKLRPGMVYSDLYSLSFNTSECTGNFIQIRIEYIFNAVNPNYDLTREIKLNINSNETSRKLFFPIFYQASDKLDTWSYPSKIKIINQPKYCIDKFHLISDRSSLPLWMDFSVIKPLVPDQLKTLYK